MNYYSEKFLRDILYSEENKNLSKKELLSKYNIDFDKIYPLMKSSSADDRSIAADFLGFDQTDATEKVLFDSINDDDELVRYNIFDSLFWSSNIQVFEKIKYFTQNEVWDVARAQSIDTYWNIYWNIHGSECSKEIFNYLTSLYDNDKSDYVKIHIAYYLYKLHDTDKLDYILLQLHNSDYHVRNITIQFLSKLVINNDSQLTKIQKAVYKAYSQEKILWIRKNMQGILVYNKELFNKIIKIKD